MIKKKAVVNYGKYTHNSQIPQKYRCCGIFPMQKVSWLFKGILHKFTKVPQISPSQRRKLTPQLHLCTKIASTDACGPDAHRIPPKSVTSKPPNLTFPTAWHLLLRLLRSYPHLWIAKTHWSISQIHIKFTSFPIRTDVKRIWKGLTAQQITSPPGCQAIWSYECCANEWGFQSGPWPVMTNNTSEPRPFHHGLRKLTPWNELL